MKRVVALLTLGVGLISSAGCSSSPQSTPAPSDTSAPAADGQTGEADSHAIQPAGNAAESLPPLGDYVLEVESYYGKYDIANKEIGVACRSLDGPYVEDWPNAPQPKQRYHVGVLFPHFRDPYWLAVNYGIIAEARRLGVSVTLLDADGYGNLGDQRRQLTSDAVDMQADGIILASIDYEKLDDAVDEVVDKGIPVIEVINDIKAAKIKAKALVSFYDMGKKAGEFVLQDAAGKDIKVVFLPGPEGSGWAEDTLVGFRAAIEESKAGGATGNVELLPELYGKTEAPVQRSRIKSVLDRNEGVDYLVGNAVAVDVATEMADDYARHGCPSRNRMSTYPPTLCPPPKSTSGDAVT